MATTYTATGGTKVVNGLYTKARRRNTAHYSDLSVFCLPLVTLPSLSSCYINCNDSSLRLHKTAEPAMGVSHHLTCHKGGGVVHVVEGSGVVANVSRMAFLLTARDDLEPLRSF